MKTGKFVQFSPEQSLDILLGAARKHAHAAAQAVVRTGKYPKRGDTPPGRAEMLAEIGKDFSINFDSPDNEKLGTTLIAEYEEWFREFLGGR